MVRHSPSILLLKTHDLYVFILLFHTANSNLKENISVAADENYFHMNVNFLHASITLLKKGNFKYLW